MSKLMTKLLVTASNTNEVDCILEINTIFQEITPANRLWWDLEMQAFESFLLRHDEEKETWESFKSFHNKAVWAWALGIFILSCLSAIIAFFL